MGLFDLFRDHPGRQPQAPTEPSAVSIAGTVLGSMITQHFFASHAGGEHLFGDTAQRATEEPEHRLDTLDEDLGDSDSSGDILSDLGGGDNTWNI